MEKAGVPSDGVCKAEYDRERAGVVRLVEELMSMCREVVPEARIMYCTYRHVSKTHREMLWAAGTYDGG